MVNRKLKWSLLALLLLVGCQSSDGPELNTSEGTFPTIQGNNLNKQSKIEGKKYIFFIWSIKIKRVKRKKNENNKFIYLFFELLSMYIKLTINPKKNTKINTSLEKLKK